MGATCADTCAPSYRSLAVLGPGEVVARAESLKEEKYTELLCTHEFTPIAVGVLSPQTIVFCQGIGTGEKKATSCCAVGECHASPSWQPSLN